MSKRRKVTTITLTPEQRERLERLWFYLGNYGPKTTSGNHSFIQRLLEQGIDERSLHTKRTPKLELPTAECEAAVEAILEMKSGSGSGSEFNDRERGFRLISNSDEHKRMDAEPEMKAVIDDMKRRSSILHVPLEGDDDTLDAA
jgi:hypothetical protein